MKKKIIQETNEIIINNSNGEILSDNSTYKTIELNSEPSFIKMYLDDLLDLMKVSDGAKRLLIVSMRKVTYDNEIILNSALRKELCLTLRIKDNTLIRLLSELESNNFIVKKQTNYYLLNHKYFYRGKWSDVKKIKAQIDYIREGRQIKIQFDTQDELQFPLD